MSQSPLPPSPGDLHDDQVISLLRSGAHAALLTAYFGEVEYRDLSQLARIAATRSKTRGQLVFVLPGIMGSRLGSVRRNASSLLWLHPAAIAGGALAQLAMPGSRSMRAVGVMLPGYLKLRLSLEIAGFRPVFHAFDWRADLERLARDFMNTIEKTGARKVHVVAHSMGGLVARRALAHDKERRIGRLVQLGAPNDGSFAPVQAMRAVYPTVRKIASLDHKHTAEVLAREVFSTLPGLYQLLPSRQSAAEIDLFDVRSWPHDDGLTPDKKMLARAKRVRASMPAADRRCSLIAGTHQETITSVSLREGAFEYEIRRDGDGTVPTSRALWPDASTWFIQENHGALTNNNRVLAAVTDILKTGSTERLGTEQPAQGPFVRRVTDNELRAAATSKVQWDRLSLDSRRRILEPTISPEFVALKPNGTDLGRIDSRQDAKLAKT